eukprot:TRINITY_DN99051_c0_g1_i1.p1 TRINITY_DN99051_c0_g1~~TRINITY_DN99051_c0_g1_i1.p1  ORF type:complete len:144 (-),score=23.67 TRINITY_DN99051_c0_g1_i1:43-474(-)
MSSFRRRPLVAFCILSGSLWTALGVATSASSNEAVAVAIDPEGIRVDALMRKERSDQPIDTCTGTEQPQGNCDLIKDQATCEASFAHCNDGTCIQCAFKFNECVSRSLGRICYKAGSKQALSARQIASRRQFPDTEREKKVRR